MLIGHEPIGVFSLGMDAYPTFIVNVESLHDGPLLIDQGSFHTFTLYQSHTGVLELIGPPYGGMFPVIPEVSNGTLSFDTSTHMSHYTLFTQEFDTSSANISINAQTGELYVRTIDVAVADDTAQIWIE